MKLPLQSVFTWNAGIFLLGFIALQLRRRGLERKFPLFTLSIWFHLIVAIVGLWSYTHLPVTISWAFLWSADALDGPLSLAVIYEIFSNSLRAYPAICKLGVLGYVIGSLALTILAIWMGIADPHSMTHRMNTAVISMNRSLGLIRVGLLFFLFCVHRFLGLIWRHYVMGIALGMGVSASLGLLSTTMQLQMGTTWWRIYVFMAPFSYEIGLAFWAYYFAMSESKVEIRDVPNSAVLQRWNSALQEMTAQ